MTTVALGELARGKGAKKKSHSLVDVAVFLFAAGAIVHALIPIALECFGSDWEKIIAGYQESTAMLPPDEDPRVLYPIRLAVCEARLEMLDVSTAIEDLTRLLQETAMVYGENAPLNEGAMQLEIKASFSARSIVGATRSTRSRNASGFAPHDDI